MPNTLSLNQKISFEKRQVHEQALKLAERYKKCEIELIEILQKVDRLRLFIDYKCRTLTQYAIEVLGLSESVAANFVTVAKAGAKIPSLQEAVSTGRVSVSKARKITPVINSKNAKEWVELAATTSTRKIEQAVKKEKPDAYVFDRTKYILESQLKLEASVSEETLELFKSAMNLVSKQMKKPVSYDEAINKLARFFLDKNHPYFKAERAVARRIKLASAAKSLNPVEETKASKKTSRAWLNHQVDLRDKCACQFEIAPGKKCLSTAFTEKHHIVPTHLGGKDTVENLITLCSAHHEYVHRQHATVQRFRKTHSRNNGFVTRNPNGRQNLSRDRQEVSPK